MKVLNPQFRGFEATIEFVFDPKGMEAEDLLCKKLICQRLEPSNMNADIANQFYSKEAEHDMYVGEVVEIIK